MSKSVRIARFEQRDRKIFKETSEADIERYQKTKQFIKQTGIIRNAIRTDIKRIAKTILQVKL